MAYLDDQQGIMRRYLRESSGWQMHLDNCRNFIKTEIKERKAGKILVLGSGWLLDFPLEELASEGREILLADINHPAQVRHKISRYNNVQSVNTDITGSLISQVYNKCRELSPGSPFPDPGSFDFSIRDIFDDDSFILSLNILNQLDILLVDYIKTKFEFDGKKEELFRKNIQDAHLEFISSHDGILISDIIEKNINLHSGISTSKSLVYSDLPVGKKSKRWDWIFDTRGLYIEDTQVEMEVVAISF